MHPGSILPDSQSNGLPGVLLRKTQNEVDQGILYYWRKELNAYRPEGTFFAELKVQGGQWLELTPGGATILTGPVEASGPLGLYVPGGLGDPVVFSKPATSPMAVLPPSEPGSPEPGILYWFQSGANAQLPLRFRWREHLQAYRDASNTSEIRKTATNWGLGVPGLPPEWTGPASSGSPVGSYVLDQDNSQTAEVRVSPPINPGAIL